MKWVPWVVASIGPLAAVYLGFTFLRTRPNCGDSFRNAVTTLVVGLVVVSVGSAVILYAATL